jgi:hypothetical protein
LLDFDAVVRHYDVIEDVHALRANRRFRGGRPCNSRR